MEQIKLRMDELVQKDAPNLHVVIWFSAKKAGAEIAYGNNSEYYPISLSSVNKWRSEVGTIFKPGEYMEFKGQRRTYADLAAMFALSVNQLKKLAKDGVITPIIGGTKGVETVFDDNAVDAIFNHFSNGQVK